MRIVRGGLTGTPLKFDAARRRASAIADELLGENMQLSWYDRERDLESPAVDFDGGRFVFCFRPLSAAVGS